MFFIFLIMFCKIGALEHAGIFTGKTPVLESLFDKVVGLSPAILLKTDSNIGVFL